MKETRSTVQPALSGKLLLFQRCPYCRRGVGDIRIDLAAALTRRPPSEEVIVLDEIQGQPVVVFQPGVAGARPCPHTIYLLIDVWTPKANCPKVDLSFVWNHPWFAEHDSNGFAKEVFWDQVVDRRQVRAEGRRELGFPSYRPELPYSVRRPVRETMYPRRGTMQRRVRCEGWAIYSVDAQAFCEELGKAAQHFVPVVQGNIKPSCHEDET